VIQADITADHRSAQGPTGFPHSLDGLGQGPVLLGNLRAGEVEAIGDGSRPRPSAGQVAGSLGHGANGALTGIQLAIPAIAVGGGGDSPLATGEAQDRSAGPWPL